VLSGAPYGYRYVKKSDTSAAFYEIIEAEAKVVRMVYEIYTEQGLSINAIALLLNERKISTRTGKSRWERSTVWGILRNPAYRGTACYGKTELRPRQRITRPLRQRKGVASRDSANHERPRGEWIPIQVPALVSEEIFALAQESWKQIKRTHRGVQSNRACCKGCWSVNSAGMRCTAVPLVRANIRCTIIDVSGQMVIGDCADRCARIVRSGKTIWTNLYGMRLFGCWKIRPWSRAKSIAVAPSPKTPIPFTNDKKSCVESKCGSRRIASD